jgi:hypothetical protein
MVELGTGPSSVRVPVPGPALGDVATLARGEARGGRVVLRLEGVGYDRHNPGRAYAVYLGVPDAPVEERHVGNVSFYGRPGARSTQEFDVTDAVRSLCARVAGAPGDVHITFRPVSVVGGDDEEDDVPRPPGEPLARIERVALTSG